MTAGKHNLSNRPPRWADRLLTCFCAEHLLEEVQGDLHERYYRRAERMGAQRARHQYWRDVLSYLRPSLMNRKSPDYSTALFSPLMLRNYLTIAWRNLAKNKVYSFINMVGLAIGLACCLAIGLYVWDEYRYDRFHRNGDCLYRVVESQNQAGTIYHVAVTPGPLAAALRTDFPEVQQTCRIGLQRAANVLQYRQKTAEPSYVLIVDHSFFDQFDFQLVWGDPRKALLDPDEVVINERTAEQLFGPAWRLQDNLSNRAIQLNDGRTLRLAGVIENAPVHSHIQYDVLLSFRYEDLYNKYSNWDSNNYHTYVQLRPDADAKALGKKLEKHLRKYSSGTSTTLSLQPLHDIYLHSDFDFGTDWTQTSSILYLRVFVAVGLVVLLIALFNFMNLATARAMQRAREVGVRKAIGAVRGQLVVQFLGESLLLTLLSIGLGLGLLQVCLPILNELSAKSLAVPFDHPSFAWTIAGVTLAVGLLAGLYPAFYLSGFQPVRVLKGVFDVRSGQLFRRVLVVSQFTLSVILVIGAIVIYQQLIFLQDKDLGFDQSQLVYVRMKNDLRGKAQLMKTDLQQQTSLAGVAGSSSNLIDVMNSTSSLNWDGKQEGDEFLVTQINIDPDFVPTTGMTMVAGRNLDARRMTDTAAYLINETAARRMGWTPQQAIDQRLTLWDRPGRVIGVVKDFHFRPLTAAIEPFLFHYWPREGYSCLLVKSQPNRTREALHTIERYYKKYDQLTAPQYEFVDQELQSQYRTQQRTGRIVLYFSVLAIVVSCLGLFGLATHTAEQRTKEIGIRKVFGATVTNIVALLSKDFLKLVCLAILIASPIAWYAANRWLQDFAYRIELAWWMFALTGVMAIVLALLTVGFQSVKAALMNPVKSLRTE